MRVISQGIRDGIALTFLADYGTYSTQQLLYLRVQ